MISRSIQETQMGFLGFGKKPQPVDRYAGKPFLKLTNSFVLKCIDELDPAHEALLVAMALAP
jgi:hypothetical protein